jgi:hypothetical protein
MSEPRFSDQGIDDPNIRPGDEVEVHDVEGMPGDDRMVHEVDDRPADQVAVHDVEGMPGDDRMVHEVDDMPVVSSTGGGLPMLPILIGIGGAVVIAVAAFSFMPKGGGSASPTSAGGGAGTATATIDLGTSKRTLTGAHCTRATSPSSPAGDGTFDSWTISFASEGDFLIAALYWPGPMDNGNFENHVKPEQSISFKVGDTQANVGEIASFDYGPTVSRTGYTGPKSVAFSGHYLVDKPIAVTIDCG